MSYSVTARQTDWSDFNWFVDSYIPRQIVRVLKEFAEAIRAETGIHMQFRGGELKASHVTKIQNAFKTMKRNDALEQYIKAREACEHIGAPQWRPPPNRTPTFGGAPDAAAGYGSSAAAGPSRTPYTTSPSGTGWSSSSASANVYNQHSRGSHYTLQDWKANPMWKPIQALTNMEPLPDISSSESSHARREKRVSLQFTLDVAEKLQYSQNNPDSIPHYSVRLFCASTDYYRSPGASYSSATAHIQNRSIPIEFPNNPDITVDSYIIPFKEKGLRGQPGSAPPFDIGKSTRGLQYSPGRLTSVAFGHTGPTNSKRKDLTKKFFFQLVLTETTTKEELLARLQQLTPTPASEALALGRKEEDDDIQLGSSVLKLRDPLSYMRIETPVRSKFCTHVQCFEARWWIEQNATHPRWRCPHCDKELNFADMIVDGAFLDILKAVNEDIEEVLLEADGNWHTEDGKYGSAAWLVDHPPLPNIVPTPAASTSGTTSLPPERSASPEKKPKRPIVEVLSESEDEDGTMPASTRPRIHPPLSTMSSSFRPSHLTASSYISLPGPTPSATSSRLSSAAPRNTDVIDLTLDSDDDDVAPPPARSSNNTMQGVVRPRSVESNDSPFPRPGTEHDRHNADDSSRPNQTSASELSRKLPELGAPHTLWGSVSRLGSGVPFHPTAPQIRRDLPVQWSNPTYRPVSDLPPPSSPSRLSPAQPVTLPLPSHTARDWVTSQPVQPPPKDLASPDPSRPAFLPPIEMLYRLPSPLPPAPKLPVLAPPLGPRALPTSSWRPRPEVAASPPSTDLTAQRGLSRRLDDSDPLEGARRSVSADLPRSDQWSDWNDDNDPDDSSEPAHRDIDTRLDDPLYLFRPPAVASIHEHKDDGAYEEWARDLRQVAAAEHDRDSPEGPSSDRDTT